MALEHGQSVEELDIAACRARQEVRRVVVVTRVTVGPHPVAVALVAGLHPLRQQRAVVVEVKGVGVVLVDVGTDPVTSAVVLAERVTDPAGLLLQLG